MNDPGTPHTEIDYEKLVEQALRSVVYRSLKLVEKEGLKGDTHFYISFLTSYQGVQLNNELKKRHPESMTIVLQHQFEDLSVNNEEFAVTLFFDGKASPMIIPFESILSFNDPSVGFGLQFGAEDDQEETDLMIDKQHDNSEEASISGVQSPVENANDVGADVVSLDTFRKKPTK